MIQSGVRAGRRPTVGLFGRLQAWGHGQVEAARSSLGRLGRNAGSGLMSLMVVAIALALPATLFTVLDNLGRLSGSFGANAEITVFLDHGAGTEQTEALAARLRDDPRVATLRVITPRAAMDEFKQLSGFGEALELLRENPMPTVLVLALGTAAPTPAAVDAFLGELNDTEGVDLARADVQWVQRLNAILAVARRGVLIVGLLLGLTVLLVIGNTIRLEVENRRNEIAVTKLVGGTDRFVRRPFLFEGIWLGLLGGGVAWLLVYAALSLLESPVGRLTGLYGSDFVLHGPGFSGFIDLATGGAMLGYLGAWAAVGRQLRRAEPG